jgi:hypothetical protein
VSYEKDDQNNSIFDADSRLADAERLREEHV